jgi:hypothetical protein
VDKCAYFRTISTHCQPPSHHVDLVHRLNSEAEHACRVLAALIYGPTSSYPQLKCDCAKVNVDGVANS